MQDAHLMLALAEGFGESPIPQLLSPHVDARALLIAPPEPPDVPPRVAERLRQHDLGERAAELRRMAEAKGVRILTPEEHDWPERLSEQPMPPQALFTRGNTDVLSQQPCVALVGSRTPTPYGVEAAEALSSALARASTVLWSGLARGIDRIAHEACLRHGTPTVAVLAGGLDRIYPPEHSELADRILADGGCVVSELPPDRRARRGHFVRRNRLLAAGPSAVVVVEGSIASGALHTARFAADCNSDVFAVPGPWQSARSQGCHRLIAEGAGIVESPQAMLQAIGLTGASAPAARALELDAEQQSILSLLDGGPRPTDLLRRECGLDAAAFLRALFTLQNIDAIARLPGDLWRRLGP